MDAAVYLRISQDRTGLQACIQSQHEDCLAHAATLGFTDPQVFIDNDVSAFDGGRRNGYTPFREACEGVNKHLDSGTTWQDNDLDDPFYLSGATGHADHIVAERHSIGLIDVDPVSRGHSGHCWLSESSPRSPSACRSCP